MADKVEIELEPTISSQAASRLAAQMKEALIQKEMDRQSGPGMGMKGLGLAAAGAAAIGGAAVASVGTANPAVMAMFNQSLEDVTGVIGHSLVPVMELMTEGARAFGDFLASVIPDTTAVLDPLKEVIEALKTAIDPLIPLIRDFLTGSLEVLAGMVRHLADAIVWVINKIPGASVSSGGGQSNWSSSHGAAAGGAAYGSVDDLNKGAIAGAYGMGGGANPAERTAKSTEQLAADVAKILEKMGGPGGDFGGFPNE